jgi:hypothetical protein
MEASFYCTDCEEPIDEADVEDHEDRGHTVRGAVRPDRLLSQDPWEQTDAEGPEQGGDDVSGDPR